MRAGTDVMRYSGWLSNEAMKLTTKLNNSYHTPEEIREILSELTGKEVDETVSLFPPFYTDCGKNISFGRRGGDERCTGKYGCGWNAGYSNQSNKIKRADYTGFYLFLGFQKFTNRG